MEIEDVECIELRAFFETYHSTVLSNGYLVRKLFKETIEDGTRSIFENDTFIVIKKSGFSFEEIEKMTIMKAKLVLAYKYPTHQKRERKPGSLFQQSRS